ncbi:MAG: hypothetical protein ACRD0Z_00350 [Acidimicrobiales bacterium]
MPRENFSRRVARAAAVGSGRSYRQQTPLTWYLTVLVIVLLGVSLIAYSRYERIHPLPKVAAKATPPTAGDEWVAAVATDDCGKLSDSLLPETSLPDEAFSNSSNGIVVIAPGNNPTDPTAYEGDKATLGAYLSTNSITLTSLLLSVPGKVVPVTTTTTTTTVAKGKSTTTSSTSTTTSSTTTTTTTQPKSAGSTTSSSSTSTSTTSSTTTTTTPTKTLPPTVLKTGTKCPAGTPMAGKTGVLEAEAWPSPTAKSGTVYTSDIGAVRFVNGQLITIALLPKGVAIPQPPVAARKDIQDFLIENPTATAPTSTTSTIPSTVATTTTTIGPATTSSTAAATTSSTTKP